MLRLAESGDWERLTLLSGERHSVLSEMFPTSDSPDLLAQCIESVQEIDRQILEYAAAERRLLSDRLSALGKGRRVNAAYAQVAAD